VTNTTNKEETATEQPKAAVPATSVKPSPAHHPVVTSLPSTTKAVDGRYFPTKYKVHPFLTKGFEETLSEGDSIYISHNGNQYFVISKDQADSGIVLGNKKFPEPANLLETI
jgi:hypothetical protein